MGTWIIRKKGGIRLEDERCLRRYVKMRDEDRGRGWGRGSRSELCNYELSIT